MREVGRLEPAEQHPDIDKRSELIPGVTREFLAEISQEWPVSGNTPAEDADLLREAHQLFVVGARTYANYSASVLKALQASELALKLRLGFDIDEKTVWSELVNDETRDRKLAPESKEWYERWHPHRNRFSHPTRHSASPASFVAPMLRSAHDHV